MATGGRELTTQLPVKLVFGAPIFDYPVCVTAVGSATVSNTWHNADQNRRKASSGADAEGFLAIP
ncbi:MAG: hypothetical protein E5X26_06400 [Mesorhizobium sp.]|nr:MAG: hypothetical protein E5X26_06400 [Mesorhizobium sp.]